MSAAYYFTKRGRPPITFRVAIDCSSDSHRVTIAAGDHKIDAFLEGKFMAYLQGSSDSAACRLLADTLAKKLIRANPSPLDLGRPLAEGEEAELAE